VGAWLAKRRRAMQVGSEVLLIVRDVVSTVSDLAQVRSEVARRVAQSDFLSTRGLEEVRKIDEREAAWLEKIRG
jgi:hypothetical protein